MKRLLQAKRRLFRRLIFRFGSQAKEVELRTRIAQLDQVETAKRTKCAIAAAVIEFYEDAIKEDAEQYLGSDDPDKDDAVMRPRSTKERP